MRNKDIKYNVKVHNKIFEVYNSKHIEIYNSYEQNRIYKIILNLVNNNKNLKVLDIGAGTGNLTLKFIESGCKVTALDVSFKSLELLKELSNNSPNLKLAILKNKKLPIDNNQFDIVCSYSVLHHIPNYLFTIQEMIRVCKYGGLIYLDHEGNENKWNPNKYLSEYYFNMKKNILGKFINLIKSKELFTYDFFKTEFIKFFINKKYQPEGDIHVWLDDHVEWYKIKNLLKKNNCKVIKEKDYLMYNPKKGLKLYRKYKNKCKDMKFLIIKKLK